MIVSKEQGAYVHLREGGRRLATVMKQVTNRVAPGVSTDELDRFARELIEATGDSPAFLGYTPGNESRPYPAASCISVNEEVVHGIPTENPRVLRPGDIVTVDIGLSHNGLITDMAFTVPVDTVDAKAAKLIAAAREALVNAVASARVGGTTGDIGAVVEAIARRHGFSVPTDLGGHGVGTSVHEPPFIPNYGKSGTGERLQEGMVLAIEPIIIEGSGDVRLLADGYTYVTKDGSRAAQFEHTVLVTSSGPEVLTIE